MTVPTDPQSSRPAPQYGQYSTPEEQRARMGVPEREVFAVPQPAARPAPVATAQPATLTPLRVIDKMVTIAALIFGALSVFQAVPLMVDPSRLLSALKISATLADPAGMRSAGIAAALTLIAMWAATAFLSWWMLRKKFVAFWVPLAAGVVANVLSSMVLLIPLMADAEVWAALEKSILGT